MIQATAEFEEEKFSKKIKIGLLVPMKDPQTRLFPHFITIITSQIKTLVQRMFSREQ